MHRSSKGDRFCVFAAVFCIFFCASAAAPLAPKNNCTKFTTSSFERILRDLKFYASTPARFTQYQISSLSSPSFQDVFFVTETPSLIQLITPESRAYTAGFILSDAIIKNLTLISECAKDISITTRMSEFLELLIALNSTNFKDAHLDDEKWIQELISNNSQTSSNLKVCFQEFAVRGNSSQSGLSMLGKQVMAYLTSFVSYKTICCARDDGSLSDPFDASIKCSVVPYEYKLLDALEALTVYFFIFIIMNYLQSRLQKILYKIKSDSLVFKYITSDRNQLGSSLRSIIMMKPYIHQFLKIAKRFLWYSKRKRGGAVVENQVSTVTQSTWALRIPFFLTHLPLMVLIVLLSFVRTFIPLGRPSVRFDEDDLRTYHLVLFGGESLREELQDNFMFNAAFLTFWSVIALLFSVTMLIQVFAFNTATWFDYVNLSEESEEATDAEYHVSQQRYFNLLIILSNLWVVLLIGMFVAFVMMLSWSIYIKIFFSLAGKSLITQYSRLGLSYPKWTPKYATSASAKAKTYFYIFLSLLNETVCLVAFYILSYFASQTFFSLIWYNVLSVVLYSSRLPVILFFATLGLIVMNMISDVMLPFETFMNLLLDRCTDSIIDLSDGHQLPSPPTAQGKRASAASVQSFQRPLGAETPHHHRLSSRARRWHHEGKGSHRDEYYKVTLSHKHLKKLLAIDTATTAPLIKDQDGNEYYVLTFELCEAIYHQVSSNYTSIDFISKYLFSVVISAITFVGFWYLSVFNSFATDQIQNVAILATGFLPQFLGMGAKARIEEYFGKRIDGAIRMELDRRGCDGSVNLAVLYNLRDREDILAWIEKQKDKRRRQKQAAKESAEQLQRTANFSLSSSTTQEVGYDGYGALDLEAATRSRRRAATMHHAEGETASLLSDEA